MRNWLPAYTLQTYTRIKRSGLLRASPPAVLAGGFLLLILIGTGLLLLPASTYEPISVLTAFFTATSAVTVTGLTLFEPAQTLTVFGRTVLIILVELGGLGFVTFAVVAAITLGRKIPLAHQTVALEAFNQTSVSKIGRTAFLVFRITVLIQSVAALILTLWWWRNHELPEALGLAVFHAVAAFNNAGFSLFPSSLAGFVSDPLTIAVITISIILGGIGYSVISDVIHKKRWDALVPYTKAILLGTLILNLVGFVSIWALEFRNPHTLGELSAHHQAWAAWMHSVTARTAGFTTVDITQFRDSTTLIMIMLMFIGGGSLSTASGIKIGTFIVLLAAVYSYVFHRKEVVLFRRAISPETVQKSLALVFVTVGLAIVGVLLMTILEDAPFLTLLFEVVSALSTTGLSRDLTPHLSAPAQVLLTILMFVGRLGPLTLVYSLGTQRRSRIRYPETPFQVG